MNTIIRHEALEMARRKPNGTPILSPNHHIPGFTAIPSQDLI